MDVSAAAAVYDGDPETTVVKTLTATLTRIIEELESRGITDAFARVLPLAVAKILKAIADEEQPGLIILGKQAIDDDANQTGQMLATLWGRPQATFASKVEVASGKATVTREVDAGLETLEVDLPDGGLGRVERDGDAYRFVPG